MWVVHCSHRNFYVCQCHLADGVALLLKLDAFHECATSLISISPENYLFFISIFNPFPELRFMVSWCDYLRDAVRVSTLLLQTPQSHHPKGHEEKDYDR